MKKKLIIPLSVSLMFLVIGGCKKESISRSEIEQPMIKNNRLVLSPLQFNSIYQKLRTDLKNGHNVKTLTVNESLKSLLNFELTKSSEEKSQTIGNHIQMVLSNAKSLDSKNNNKPKIQEVNNAIINNNSNLSLYPAILNDLVENIPLKSLINEQGEIQVGSTLYKISPYGTFYVDINKEESLQEVYNLVANQNDMAIRLI